MEIFPLLLLLSTTCAITSAKHRGREYGGTNYGSFEQCLRDDGVDPDRIVQRNNSEAYQHLNYQWQIKGPHLTPLAYILVQNEADVISTVRCGRKFNIRIVPKGGGHSLGKFAFGDSNSVIVDVRNLTTVEYNESEKTAKVGSGWQIGPLAWKLWELGKIFTPLGICPTIGISGMATGGGEGLFVRKFGLSLDNILEIRIVTANGELLTANKTNNSDLFWALRGGVGSSFGIVTQFVFRVYPAPPFVFVGVLTYPFSEFPQVFAAWQREVRHAPNDLSGEMDVDTEEVIVTLVDWTGLDINFEAVTKEFPPNATISNTKLTYTEFLLYNAREVSSEVFSPQTVLNSASDLANLVRESPGQIYQKRKSFYVNKEIGAEEIGRFQKSLEIIPPGVSVFFEAYGGVNSEIGRNETAFVHRKGTLYNAVANYRTEVLNETMDAIGTSFVEKFFEVGKSIFEHTESYQNYVDEELPNYLERYFGSNLPRLVQIKRKYDPDNFFFNQQSIPTHMPSYES